MTGTGRAVHFPKVKNAVVHILTVCCLQLHAAVAVLGHLAAQIRARPKLKATSVRVNGLQSVVMLVCARCRFAKLLSPQFPLEKLSQTASVDLTR